MSSISSLQFSFLMKMENSHYEHISSSRKTHGFCCVKMKHILSLFFFSNDYVNVIYDLHNSIGKNLTSFSRDTDASWESLEHKCRVCNTRFCEFTQTFQFLMPIKLVFSKKWYILCQSLYRIASKLSKFTSDGWQTALKWQFASFNLNKRQVDMMARNGF